MRPDSKLAFCILADILWPQMISLEDYAIPQLLICGQSNFLVVIVAWPNNNVYMRHVPYA